MVIAYSNDNVFAPTTEKANRWIREIGAALGVDDSHVAYEAVRAVLHALRDRFSVEECALFASQLPLIMRGIFFEGWQPLDRRPPVKAAVEFFRDVNDRHSALPVVDAETMTESVFVVLSRHVNASDTEKIKDTLPPPLRELWPIRTRAAASVPR